MAIVAVLLAACGPPSPPPSGLDGLRLIAGRFLEPGADPRAIALSLRPEEAEYADVFRLDRLADARLHYAGYWQHATIIGPSPEQTEFTVHEPGHQH